MDNMEKIKDRVAKLLALAGNNPSAEEAKKALLKAREIMAEHKLLPHECGYIKSQKVITSLVGVDVTGRKNSWGCELSAIIAKHYCCLAYRSHKKYEKTQRIGFSGLEDDFAICSRVFRYAFDCVAEESERIFKDGEGWYSTSYRRQRAESYGWAFCRGLHAAFEEQNKEHQEWGLVLVVPPEVKNGELGNSKSSVYGSRKTCDDRDIMKKGYSDGYNFDPSNKLENRGYSLPA